eukprot:Gb_04223 [translate_table: standard]
MSSRKQALRNLESRAVPVSVSDGQRNALMEYDDIKFMNEDVQEVDKDSFPLDTEVRQAGLPRFNIDEHLEVQLRFDGLDETHILLDDHNQCEEHWGSGFSRQDNGALGLETTSQNIAFSASGTNAFKASSLLRHTNVWSEATSSESVQMLLNSIRQDEFNMTTEANLADVGELISSSHNQAEINMWNVSKSLKVESSPSRLHDVSEIEFETIDEKNQPGLEQSAMDAREDRRELPIVLNVSEGLGSKQDSSMLIVSSSAIDYRPEENTHVLVMDDSCEVNKSEHDTSKVVVNSLPHTDSTEQANVESKNEREDVCPQQSKGSEHAKDEILHNWVLKKETEGTVNQNSTDAVDLRDLEILELQSSRETLANEVRELITIPRFSHEVSSAFGQAEIQGTSAFLLDGDNKGSHSPEKHVTGGSQEDTVPMAEQEEGDRNNSRRHAMKVSQDDFMMENMQGTEDLVLDLGKENTGIDSENWMDAGDKREGEVTPLSVESSDNELKQFASLVGSSGQASAGCGQAEIQERPDCSLDEMVKDNKENHMANTSKDNAVVVELKGISELPSDRSNEKSVEEDVVAVQLNGTPEILLDRSNQKIPQRDAAVAPLEEDVLADMNGVGVVVGESKEILDFFLDESNEKNAQGAAAAAVKLTNENNQKSPPKHAAVSLPEDAVLEDIQGMPESVFGASNQDNTRMCTKEASPEDVMLTQMEGIPDPLVDKVEEGIGMDSRNREEELTEFPRGRERLDGEVRKYSTVVGSSHVVRTGFSQAQIQGTSDSFLKEINKASALKHVMEDSLQNDLKLERKGGSESFLDERNGKSARRHTTETSCEDALLMDIQGMPQAAFDLSNEDDIGMIATKADQKDATVEEMEGISDLLLDGKKEGKGSHNWTEPVNERKGEMIECEEMVDKEMRECNTVAESFHPVAANFRCAENKGILDSLVDESNRDNVRKHTTEVMQGTAILVEMQGVSEFPLAEGIENIAEKHVRAASKESAIRVDMQGMSGLLLDAVSQNNVGEHAAEASQGGDAILAETLGMPSQDEINARKNFVGDSQGNVSLSQMQGMSNSLLTEGSRTNAQKHALDACEDDVVRVEMQGTSDPLMNEINKDSAQKHAIEALPENDLEGQQVLGTNNERSVGNSSLLDNSLENVAGVLAQEKSLTEIEVDTQEQKSGLLKGSEKGLENFKEKGLKCGLGCFASKGNSFIENKGFTGRHVVLGQDINDSVRNRQTHSDSEVKDSKVVPTSISPGESISSFELSSQALKTAQSMAGTDDEKTSKEQAKIVSMDDVQSHSEGIDILASEVQEAKDVSGIQVDVPTVSVSVEITSVNTTLQNEDITEAVEVVNNCKYGEPLPALQELKVAEDVDLSPKQRRTLQGKSSSLGSVFCVIGSSGSTTRGAHEEAGMTSQFSSDASLSLETISDQTIHNLGDESQVMKSLVMDPVSLRNNLKPNVSLLLGTERFDKSFMSSSTGSGGEKSLEMNYSSTRTESVLVHELSHKSLSCDKNSAFLLEAGQIQDTKERDGDAKCLLTCLESGIIVKDNASPCNDMNPQRKSGSTSRESMPLVSFIGEKTTQPIAEATCMEEPNELTLFKEETLADACSQPIQIAQSSIEIEDGHKQTGRLNWESENSDKADRIRKEVEDGHTKQACLLNHESDNSINATQLSAEVTSAQEPNELRTALVKSVQPIQIARTDLEIENGHAKQTGLMNQKIEESFKAARTSMEIDDAHNKHAGFMNQESEKSGKVAVTDMEIEDGNTKQAGLTNLESEKSVNVDHSLFEGIAQDQWHIESNLPCNEQQCVMTPDPGNNIQWRGNLHIENLDSKGILEAGKAGQDVLNVITIPVPVKDKKEGEKDENDECNVETAEVSHKIASSFQTDNGLPAMVGVDKPSQEAILQDNKQPSEKCVLDPAVDCSFQAKDGEAKAEIQGSKGILQCKTVCPSDDTFSFEVQAGTVLSGDSGDASADLPTSVCWKSFHSCQPTEAIQNDSSAPCDSRGGPHQISHLPKAFQEKAENNGTGKSAVNDAHSVFKEDDFCQTAGKANREKESLVDIVKELDKELPNFNHNSEERQRMSLCSVTDMKSAPISSGTHMFKNSLSSSAGLTNIGPKCHPPTSVQTRTLPDLNTKAAPLQQPFTDSQQLQLRAQILAYGSLIQGSLPEESLMIAAFGDVVGSHNGSVSSESRRSLWEESWHLAAAKIQGKVFSNISEMSTPTTTSSSMPSVLASNFLEEGTRVVSPSLTMTDSRNQPVMGMRSVDLAAAKAHSAQTGLVGSPNIGRVGHKNSPVAIMSLPHPVSSPSPVWGMSIRTHEGMHGSDMARNLHLDSHQITPPRHICQTPQLGNYASGSTSPWVCQSPSPLPWIASRAISEPGLPFSTFLMPEGSQGMLNGRSFVPPCMPYKPMLPSVTPACSTMEGATVAHAGPNAKTGSQKSDVGVGRQSSVEHKSRKRRKSRVLEEIVGTSGSIPSALASCAPGVATTLPAASAVSSAGSLVVALTNHAGGMPSSVVTTGSSMPCVPSASHYKIISRGEGEHRVIFSEETASCIEQAKLYAEEAASVAATAVRHSQSIWNQLGMQENSGLSPDREAKLASSAVAAAAAASVAKAAAAAAKVAHEAALQAKLMAAEALSSNSTTYGNLSGGEGLLEGGKQGKAIASRASMKGRGKDATSSWQMSNSSHSKLAVARDNTMNRVEAVSAATKRAQNLDAIETAAGLAAEAVSQAGAVVAMGDPVPLMLSTLLNAGPDGYWKLVNEVARSSERLDSGQNETQSHPREDTGFLERSPRMLKGKENKEVFIKESPKKTIDSIKTSSKGLSSQRDGIHTQMSDDLRGDVSPIRKDSQVLEENHVLDAGQTGTSVFNVEASAREEVAIPENEPVTKVKDAAVSKTNQIRDGSLVEVVSDEEGLRGVWFSAKVLSLQDGKALVRYDELLSEEGSIQLQEWIPLEGESGKAPRIRMAHPMMAIKFEGTRKRRRAAMGNHVWSVGDHADAWIRDGWWEGIVMGKNEDESKVTVYFPGEGDTSIIKAWNLRPSLVWKDGQWVEWAYSNVEKEVTCEDDLPLGKRQKVEKEDTGKEDKSKDKLQKIPNVEEGKKVQELSAVMSSVKDLKYSAPMKSFRDGGSAMNNKANRAGLKNEGSKVTFGVPKAAKKRKFMDVSRHYAADRMARSSPERNATSKMDKSKALPFRSQSGWKMNQVEDKRGKRPTVSKPPESKLGKKGQDAQNRTETEKNKISVANPTATKKDVSGHDSVPTSTPSVNIDGSKAARRIVMGGNGSSLSASKEIAARRPSPFAQVKALLVGEREQGSKGKQSCSSNSSSQNVEKNAVRQEITKERDSGKTATDGIEPRRSNRRIQPTSRLLEGLQSAQEKGIKVQSKSSTLIPKGNATG